MSILSFKRRLWISNSPKMFIIFSSIAGIFLLFFNLLQIIISHLKSDSIYITIIDVVTLMIYVWILIINIFEMVKLEKQNTKIHALEDYNETLLEMNDNIYGFRHDFSNIIQALDGYVETNNMEGVKSMSASILKECVCTRNLELLNPNVIKNGAIYSIISKKYFLAQSKKLNMNLEILTDLSDIEDISYEVCRILSILLDNAIEAALHCEDGFINLRILEDSKVERKLVIVENTYKNKDIDLDKVFEKGYTSKAKDLQKHGLGLWNVRKILEKTDRLNLYTTKGELFSQQLEIY